MSTAVGLLPHELSTEDTVPRNTREQSEMEPEVKSIRGFLRSIQREAFCPYR